MKSPLVLKKEGIQVLHLKTRREYLRHSEGFLHAESTDEAKEFMQTQDTDQMLKVYSGATELQGFVNFSERGLSDLFIVGSNTHCILQVLMSKPSFKGLRMLLASCLCPLVSSILAFGCKVF
jgi:hypothetical protein